MRKIDFLSFRIVLNVKDEALSVVQPAQYTPPPPPSPLITDRGCICILRIWNFTYNKEVW